MNRIRADILEIAFKEGGPPDSIPVLLLHGWPDSALTRRYRVTVLTSLRTDQPSKR